MLYKNMSLFNLFVTFSKSAELLLFVSYVGEEAHRVLTELHMSQLRIFRYFSHVSNLFV